MMYDPCSFSLTKNWWSNSVSGHLRVQTLKRLTWPDLTICRTACWHRNDMAQQCFPCTASVQNHLSKSSHNSVRHGMTLGFAGQCQGRPLIPFDFDCYPVSAPSQTGEASARLPRCLVSPQQFNSSCPMGLQMAELDYFLCRSSCLRPRI
jgi:hypothetical protein